MMVETMGTSSCAVLKMLAPMASDPAMRERFAAVRRANKVALARLVGIERAIYMQVGEFARVTPIANEDLERETEGKTSAVHFLRFELTPEMAAAAKAGAPIRAGIDHPHYHAEVLLPAANRDALASDLA